MHLAQCKWTNVQRSWTLIAWSLKSAKVGIRQALKELLLGEPQCDVSGTYCPVDCSCKDTVVRCSNRVCLHKNTLTQFCRISHQFLLEFQMTLLNSFLIPIRLSISPWSQSTGWQNWQNCKADCFLKMEWAFRDFSHNLLESIENHAFAKLSRLSTLILSYNKIKVVRYRRPLISNNYSVFNLSPLMVSLPFEFCHSTEMTYQYCQNQPFPVLEISLTCKRQVLK